MSHIILDPRTVAKLNGLRDRVASRAAENGRSMNTEIIEAIERHLQGSDRISEIWQFIQEHREDIKAIDRIRDAVYALEAYATHYDDAFYDALTRHRKMTSLSI
jgi:hypothetical protein